MPISLGNTSINSLQLGSTSINKAYLGEELVFGGGIDLSSSIISYYNFDNNVNDQKGSNNGIPTSLQYSNVRTGAINSYANAALTITPSVEIASYDLNFGDGLTDEPFSFSFGIANGGAGTSVILTRRDGVNYEYQYVISSNNHLLRLIDGNSLSNRLEVTWNPVGIINPTVFESVTWTYDGSGSENGINVYHQGILQTVARSTIGTYVAMDNTGSSTWLFKNGPTQGNHYRGELDEIYFYNKELTQEEVTFVSDEFNAGRTLI